MSLVSMLRTDPFSGAVDALGAAKATASVTVNSVAASVRKGEYFWKEVSAANSTVSVWQSLSITATEGANNQTTSGNVFVPKTPELYTYDLDGNVLTDGRWTYTWDGENRLTRLVPISSTVGPQTRIDFEYDWQGRRIAKKVWNNVTGTGTQKISERFLYDGWNLVSQLNASNNAVVRSYVWGSDLSGSLQGAGGVGGLLAVKDTANGMHFAAYDGNGNVVALVSAVDASVSARYEYGPFSELLRCSGPLAKLNPFRFSTKFQDDETDLLYYGYRYLNSSSGRWLSRDRIEEDGGVNISAFVGNDPISWIDPTGLKQTWQFSYNFGTVFIGGAVERDKNYLGLKGEFGGSFIPAPLDLANKQVNRFLRRFDYELRLQATVSGSFHISINTCGGKLDNDTKVCGNFTVSALLRHQTRTPGGQYDRHEPFGVGAYAQGSLCAYICSGQIKAETEWGAFFQIVDPSDTRWASWRDFFNFQSGGSEDFDIGTWSLPPSLFGKYCRN